MQSLFVLVLLSVAGNLDLIKPKILLIRLGRHVVSPTCPLSCLFSLLSHMLQKGVGKVHVVPHLVQVYPTQSNSFIAFWPPGK